MTNFLIHYIDLPCGDNNHQLEAGFFRYDRDTNSRTHQFTAVNNPDDASNFTLEEAQDTKRWLHHVMPGANITIMEVTQQRRSNNERDEKDSFVDTRDSQVSYHGTPYPSTRRSEAEEMSNIPPPGAASDNPRDLVVKHRQDIGLGNLPNLEPLPEAMLMKLRNLWQDPAHHEQVTFIVDEMSKDILKMEL